jgi:hypothetical protein
MNGINEDKEDSSIPDRGRINSGQFLKLSRLPVFSHIIPIKISAIHGYINANRQRLNKCQCASQVEEAIRAAELVGYHRAG